MRSLRFLVACILLLAIPLQGMAAAGMLFCGGGHGPAVGAAAGADHHHHADAKVAHDHAGNPDHDHAAGQLPDAKCSVCAACCAGAGATSEAPHVPAFAVAADAPPPASMGALRVRVMPPPDKPPRA